MRILIVAILLCISLLPTVGRGETPAQQELVDAASNEAYQTLRGHILSAPLGENLTVENLVDRADAGADLSHLLSAAKQIGGTRWLGEDTVQVRVELRGDDLAALIERLADRSPGALGGIPKWTIHERVRRDMSRRVFSATAACTAASAIRLLRPEPTQLAWANVSDQARVAAIDTARRNAIDRSLDSVKPIVWDHGRRLADVLVLPEVRENLRDWFWGRPVTSIEFHDDLEVRLSLAVRSSNFWPALLKELEAQKAVPAPKGKGWERIHSQVQEQLAPAEGAAIAQATMPAQGQPAPMALREAPAWVGDSVSVVGVATSNGGSKLRTARAAENAALGTVRTRVELLQLTPILTIGQAAQQDPRMGDAVSRALAQSHLARVEYDTPAPGAVRVTVTLDLNAVWREIAGR